MPRYRRRPVLGLRRRMDRRPGGVRRGMRCGWGLVLGLLRRGRDDGQVLPGRRWMRRGRGQPGSGCRRRCAARPLTALGQRRMAWSCRGLDCGRRAVLAGGGQRRTARLGRDLPGGRMGMVDRLGGSARRRRARPV
ncbi:hypothetical protein KXR53_27935, partial [Inquilinus limosus]|uniref:hypothetical protein n=1 Tax=Inquilinus limosus TaxID=171674 RepID=UPI003F168B11